MDITRWLTLKSYSLHSLQPKMNNLYTVKKNKTGADCGSDHELLIAKFRLRLKKVGKTSRLFSSVHSLSCVQLFVTPWWTAACQASCLSPDTQTHVQWVGDEIQKSHPLSSLLLLPSIFPSIRVFSTESALCIRWPKYWSFSFSISPYNEHPGLISFTMDWLELLAVQGTLKSLL